MLGRREDKKVGAFALCTCWQLPTTSSDKQERIPKGYVRDGKNRRTTYLPRQALSGTTNRGEQNSLILCGGVRGAHLRNPDRGTSQPTRVVQRLLAYVRFRVRRKRIKNHRRGHTYGQKVYVCPWEGILPLNHELQITMPPFPSSIDCLFIVVCEEQQHRPILRRTTKPCDPATLFSRRHSLSAARSMCLG